MCKIFRCEKEKGFQTDILIEYCYSRLVQVLAELDGDGVASSKRDDSEAVRALRAVRVLRPLKLVSGVPSR